MNSEMQEKAREMTHMLEEVYDKQVQIARSVISAKAQLQMSMEDNQRVHMQYNSYRDKCTRLDAKIVHLEDSLCRLEGTVKDNMEKAEKLSYGKDVCQWQQVRASLIHTNEKALQCKHNQVMREYSRDTLAAMSMSALSNQGCSVSQQEKVVCRKQALEARKQVLASTVEQRKWDRQLLTEQIAKAERENLVLQKRNTAIQLRLKRQLQEHTCRRKHVQSRLQALQEILKQKRQLLSEKKGKIMLQ